VTSHSTIHAFIAQPAVAVVGVSRTGKKFGNVACRELRARGYRVYPVHPTGALIDGVHTYPALRDVPEKIDAVLVVVPPREALEVVHAAAASGIHHVWLQQGAESPDVLDACRQHNLEVVAGECILMFAQPTGLHKMHYWVDRIVRRRPAA